MPYLQQLKHDISTLGKQQWQPLLQYVAELHEKSIHPADDTFPYPWEEIGPGYCYGPAFGHWDIVHQAMDTVAWAPKHARQQLLNNLHHQQEDGLLPGSIWMREIEGTQALSPQWSSKVTHPPVWPVLAEILWGMEKDQALLEYCYQKLLGQLQWWNTYRLAEDGGYFYTDISTLKWESGIDEGIRFLSVQPGEYTCVDASSQIYWLYEHAAKWASELGIDPQAHLVRSTQLRKFIQEAMWSDQRQSFFDLWAIRNPEQQKITHENFWPLIVGAATSVQAEAMIQQYLIDGDHFTTAHPIATVSRQDPNFEQRMWRGPAWNSITCWIARGCIRYGFTDLAGDLLEAALDRSAEVYDKTGTIWEFYHSEGGDPQKVQRKPHTPYNSPCTDYLGHNPLLDMARLWEQCTQG